MIASSRHLGRVLLATRTALFTPENSLEFGFQKSSLCHFCATFGFLKGFSGLADLFAAGASKRHATGQAARELGQRR